MQADPQHIAWQPERFLWAVLDAPGACRAGPLPPGLQAAFEEEAPLGNVDFQIVCAPMSDGRVLACAAPRPALRELDAQTLSLTPADLPRFAAGLASPGALNLLVGSFEPRPIRRERTRRHIAMMGTVMLCTTLACVGLARRTQVWLDRAREASAAIHVVTASALPDGGSLAAELERVRRAAAVETRPASDASIALASLLRAWPAGTSAKPIDVSVGGETAAIAVALEGDATEFLKALSPPAGWMLDEPRLTRTQSLTRLNLTLHRAAGGGS